MRSEFASLFRGEAGRNFWAETRAARFRAAGSRRASRFCQLLDEEYEKAINMGPPAIGADELDIKTSQSQQIASPNLAMKDGITLLLGIAGGIAIKSLMRRRRL